MQHTTFLETALKTAIEAAQAGEAVIRHYYEKNIQVQIKEDLTPVTVADVETEQAIKAVLQGAFPEHGFYGEETGASNNGSEYTWLVDPIDGTKAFVRQYPMFSTQIALMKGDELILGVSNAPMFNGGEMAWAAQGQGAFLNGQPIHVSGIEKLDQAALSAGNIKSLAQSAQWAGFGKICQTVNRTRGYGDFLHYHLLASGRIDLVIESDVNILDIAALCVIVREAGGVFTDLHGESPRLDTRNVMAAANRALYDQARTMLEG
ncbi:MAG TPA: inositol-phosphate phosphatase [bacterium]|nr:inositol-phosphate phosphatase [bacterium]